MADTVHVLMEARFWRGDRRSRTCRTGCCGSQVSPNASPERQRRDPPGRSHPAARARMSRSQPGADEELAGDVGGQVKKGACHGDAESWRRETPCRGRGRSAWLERTEQGGVRGDAAEENWPSPQASYTHC